MNPQQFIEFLANAGATTTSPPRNPFKLEWKKIKDAIKPHFYGEVPKALLEAFPNEEPVILKYRTETYQAKTESPLVKAITDLRRLLSNSKHSVNYENAQMEEWVRDYRIGDNTLFEHFFKVVTPYRQLDPNALYVIWPTGDGFDDDTQRVDVAMQIIQNERVIFNDPEYNLIIFEGVTKPKYSSSVLATTQGIYYVVTDQFYGIIRNGKFDPESIYLHEMGINPWFTLGGRAVPRYDDFGNMYTVYKSDMSPAIPYLNDAAIYDNQHRSVMLSTCFPQKVIEGIDCDYAGCNDGYIYDDEHPDTPKTCPSCNGSGRKPFYVSPLNAIYLSPPPKGYGGQDESGKRPDPIRYFGPPVDTIKITSEEAKASLIKAENILNINRSLKQAQSGVAKEMDREPEYLEVAKISDDLYAKYNHTLNVIQGLVFMSDAKIVVTPPVSFDLKTEVELMAELAESMKGMDTSVRYGSYLSYVDQRYAQNAPFKMISKLSVDYTNFILFTIQERAEMQATGEMTQQDAIRAAYAFQTILGLYQDGQINVFDDDQNTIFERADEVLAPIFTGLTAVEVPQDFDNDGNAI